MSTTVTIRPNSYETISGANLSDSTNVYDGDLSTEGRCMTAFKGYFAFDFSTIPQNAVILSCTVYMRGLTPARGNGALDIMSSKATTIKGNAIGIPKTSANTVSYTLTTQEATAWITSSTAGVAVYQTVSRITTRLYEIWAVIEYEEVVTATKVKVKVNGAWVEADVLVKVNGDWVSVDEAFVKANGSWKTVT